MGTVDPRLPKVPKTGPFASDRLDSWKDIARYLNRDVRTVQRWEETGGLPVYRRTEGRVRGAVFAYKSELDEWLRQSPPPPNGKEEQPARVSSPWWRTWRVLWVAVPVLILAARRHSLAPGSVEACGSTDSGCASNQVCRGGANARVFSGRKANRLCLERRKAGQYDIYVKIRHTPESHCG